MLLIPCPWCGERGADEFVHGGDAHVRRPADPAAVSDEAWTDYLYFQDNPRGAYEEWWFHAYGCHRWFSVTRDTVTHALSTHALSTDAASPSPDAASPPPEAPFPSEEGA